MNRALKIHARLPSKIVDDLKRQIFRSTAC